VAASQAITLLLAIHEPLRTYGTLWFVELAPERVASGLASNQCQFNRRQGHKIAEHLLPHMRFSPLVDKLFPKCSEEMEVAQQKNLHGGAALPWKRLEYPWTEGNVLPDRFSRRASAHEKSYLASRTA